jgi:putative phosphoserine phosphatase/1-acylglycerol-3-phosphate O-acyltransferase
VLWGPGKADAVARFADAHGIELTSSFAYSDGHEDVAMLQLVGHPHAVNGGAALNDVADTNGWARLECTSQAPATPLDRVRSWLALSSFTPVMTAAAAVGLTRSDLGATSRVVTTVWPRLALGIGGVEVRVDGAENLHGHRPAVVVFNHHTLLDELVVGDLLRRNYVMVLHDHHMIERVVSAIGKRLGPVVSEDDTGDTTTSIAAALDSGRTVAIALPEHPRRSVDIAGNGARALRLAAESGVPVIPVDVLDAADLQRSMGSFRPGVVNVRVARPIEVEALRTNLPGARRRLAAAFDNHY